MKRLCLNKKETGRLGPAKIPAHQSCFVPNGCAPTAWGNHAWVMLHELALRGASIALIREICSLLTCASCRDSIKQFQYLVPLTGVESVPHWVDLAHMFVDSKVGKTPVHKVYTAPEDSKTADEELSFHLTMTLCFFFEHHSRERLQFFVSLLTSFLQPRMPWLLAGISAADSAILVGCHNLQFPASVLEWEFVAWIIDTSRSSVR